MRYFSGSFWTPDTDARLQRLEAQGLSAAKIAAKLGVSRNSVIARSQRLRGLSHPSKTPVENFRQRNNSCCRQGVTSSCRPTESAQAVFARLCAPDFSRSFPENGTKPLPHPPRARIRGGAVRVTVPLRHAATSRVAVVSDWVPCAVCCLSVPQHNRNPRLESRSSYTRNALLANSPVAAAPAMTARATAVGAVLSIPRAIPVLQESRHFAQTLRLFLA